MNCDAARALLIVLLILVVSCQQPPAPAAREAEPTEDPRPAMPQTLHVVALGDSLAYGAGDERGGGIAARLSDELRSRGVSRVEAVNLGVNGAQTADLIQRLEQQRVRSAVEQSDAVILSIGANDLFRSPHSREELMRAPFAVAERILGRIEEIIAELHEINPQARVLVLGAYNPVPRHEWASLIDQYLVMWDEALAARFEDEPRVAVVKMADIVAPNRLSRFDSFHPGAAAYDAAAKRIAGMLLSDLNAA